MQEPPKPTSNWLDRLHAQFWIGTPDGDYVGPTANDLIKSVFDSIRNIALTLAVLFGARQLDLYAAKLSDPTAQLWLGMLSNATYITAGALFYLCLQYAINVMTQTRRVQKARYPFFILLALLFPLALALALVGLAIYLARTNGANAA